MERHGKPTHAIMAALRTYVYYPISAARCPVCKNNNVRIIPENVGLVCLDCLHTFNNEESV